MLSFPDPIGQFAIFYLKHVLQFNLKEKHFSNQVKESLKTVVFSKQLMIFSSIILNLEPNIIYIIVWFYSFNF